MVSMRRSLVAVVAMAVVAFILCEAGFFLLRRCRGRITPESLGWSPPLGETGAGADG